MMSDKVIKTDAFMDMGDSSKVLYFYLMIEADDDGFISNPKTIMRMIGSNADDYKILIAKRFLIVFQSGVCVIKHWRIHNLIRADRYHETQWIEEKNSLIVDKKTSKYSLNKGGIPNGNQLATEVRLGKVREGEVRKELAKKKTVSAKQRTPSKKKPKSVIIAETSSAGIVQILESFQENEINPKNMYGNKTQRKACEELIGKFGLEKVLAVLKNVVPKTNAKPRYEFPDVRTPVQLLEGWYKIGSGLQRAKEEKEQLKSNVI